jgi:hypothetical protein
MRKTYIATTQEAKALFDGTQTAIISKMRVQPKDCSHIHRQTDEDCPWRNEPQKLNVGHFDNAVCSYCGYGIGGDGSFMFPIPYAIGQEVVVREAWVYVYDSLTNTTTPEAKTGGTFEHFGGARWQSPATMPVSAARTRFRIVSCEAVRVRDVTEEQAKQLAVELYKNKDGSYGGWEAPMTYKESAELYLIHKLGQSAWDNNDYVFYYKIEKI